MIREILLTLSPEQLQENQRRLLLSIDDLEYLLQELQGERDELDSTNTMLKQTLEALQPASHSSIVERAKAFVRSKLERWNTAGSSALYPKYDEFEVVEGQDPEEWKAIMAQLGESLPASK